MTLSIPDLDPEGGVIAAALAYAAAGWYVLPVDPGTKHPGSVLGKGWPAKSSRDPQVIADWFLLEPHALALHVGRSGAVAFDVDDPAALPPDLAAALAGAGAPHQSTREGVQGRGHHLFQVPPGRMFGNSAAGFEGGWGEVRGKNGIIVVAPSVHAKADDGGRYAWVRTGPLPALPPALAERLRDASESADAATDPEVTQFLAEHTRAERPALLRAITARFTADVAAGRSRHDSMLLPCANAMREARAGMYPARSAAEALCALFVDATSRSRDGVERVLSASWARAEFGGILAWAIAQARAATPAQMAELAEGIEERAPAERDLSDLIAPPAPSAPSAPSTDGALATVHHLNPQAATAEEARRLTRERMIAEEALKLEVREEAKRRLRARQRPAEPPRITALNEFLAIEDPPQRYRLEGLWPLGGRAMLAAQFKAGKTTMVGNLVRSLVDGDPFLGRFTVEPLAEERRVVVIDDELDERMIRAWLRDQGIANPDRAAVLSLRGKLSSFDILDPQVRTQWAAALRAAGAEVVILDCLAPLLDALGLSEDKEAGQLLVAFDELLGEAGVAEAVVVHHMGHSGERSRGASRLRDWPDVEWRLVREKTEGGADDPSAPRYFSAYGRDVDVPESALAFDPASRRLTLTGGSRAGAALRGAREAIVELLATRPGLSGRSIEDELGEEFKRADVRAALKRAVAEGQIRTAPGPRRSVLHSVDETWRDGAAGLLPTPPASAPSHPIQCADECADQIGLNTVSAGGAQCASAPSEIGLIAAPSEPVRRPSGALNPQVTDSVRQCAESAPAQSGASAPVRPPKGGRRTGALTRPDPGPGGELDPSNPVAVVDGSVVDSATGRPLTAAGDDLIDPDTGEIRGTLADLRAALRIPGG
ncbi:AAA family ATPase [Allonocardiopsis opalescens]|uniref:AAA domain-containing protein n=1 Tax=Allonocardiopsis opalescens TaxID=1144618 RepID=A0A2T0PVP1_9ACTN|nr:AAA family ATPase [Allonocardiopsis opalescens]PRX95599.1 AAA domain-containing protein [Allonocardiopsis opalescens]